MTKAKRFLYIIQGIASLGLALILIFFSTEGLTAVVGIIGLGLTINGIRALVYYFTMARYMVGGKFVLYRGIIFLDAGVFTSVVADNPILYVILYIAVLHAFAGAVSIMGAIESGRSGSPNWRSRAANGMVNIILAVMVIVAGLVMHRTVIVVDIYAGGLIYSALYRIVSAFRKSAIVYIQ